MARILGGTKTEVEVVGAQWREGMGQKVMLGCPHGPAPFALNLVSEVNGRVGVGVAGQSIFICGSGRVQRGTQSIVYPVVVVSWWGRNL